MVTKDKNWGKFKPRTTIVIQITENEKPEIIGDPLNCRKREARNK